MADTPLFTPDELKQYRYKCSHKLAISLTVGAVYLCIMTLLLLNKVLHHEVSLQNKLYYYGFGAVAYVLLIVLICMLVHRSQTLNFSRFLRGCVEFGKFELMLEYVEMRMPGPFPPRILKYPVHLMILGKVLEHSEIPENAAVGRRMIAAAADRDPELGSLREAPLADVMEFHRGFLAVHPEIVGEWRSAERFHRMLVCYVLPILVIVGIVSIVMFRYARSKKKEKDNLPVMESVQKTDASQKTDAPGNGTKQEAAPAAAETDGPDGPVTPQTPETVPPQA